MVLANHRSSIPPRWVPRAYQSVGASLIRLPGWRKFRGTQFGVSRRMPLPASMARLRIAPTLSRFTILDGLMADQCSSKSDLIVNKVLWIAAYGRGILFYSLAASLTSDGDRRLAAAATRPAPRSKLHPAPTSGTP